MAGNLSFRLLGGHRIGWQSGEPVEPLGRKATALLCYLAMQAGRPQHREDLAALLWPDRFDEQARHSLRQVLHELRRRLGEASPLAAENGAVAMDGGRVDVDAMELRDGLAAGRDESALRDYRGELLAGFHLRAEPFEQWLADERRRLQDEVCAALMRLATARAADGDADTAAAAARRLTELDPANESAHRLLMRLHHEAGRRSEALRRYETCARALRRELDVEPSAETAALHARIRAADPGPSCAAVALPAHLQPQPPPADRPSVLVLPFVDRAGGQADEHLVDAVTDEVIAALGRYRWLFVIGRNTSFAFKERIVDPAHVADELGVRYVVSGSVLRLDGRVRVLAEVVDAPDRHVVWSERQERPLTDFYEMQDTLARHLVGAIEPQLLAAEEQRAVSQRVTDPTAWEQSLRAQMLLHRGTHDDVMEADQLLCSVIAQAPDLPFAQKLLASARYMRAINLWHGEVAALLDDAMRAATAALRHDEQDAEAWFLAAQVRRFLGKRELALTEASRAVELNPSSAHSHVILGSCLNLVGRHEEALASFAEARRLSPRDRRLAYWLCAESFTYFCMGRYEEAIACDRQSLQLTQTWLWSRAILAASLACLDRQAEAQAELRELQQLAPGATVRKLGIEPDGMPGRLAAALRRAGLPE